MYRHREESLKIMEAYFRNRQEGIMELCRRFCETMENDLADRIVESYHAWTSCDYKKDSSIYQSRCCMDFEKWWLYPRPLIAEW